MPGTFKIFFVDVVLNMARAAETLTLPMTVYVDDLAATGATAKGTTSRMAKFQDWAEKICGVGDVFNIFPKMVQAPEPVVPVVACWATAPPEGSDGEVEDDEVEEDEDDEVDEEPAPVAMPTPALQDNQSSASASKLGRVGW